MAYSYATETGCQPFEMEEYPSRTAKLSTLTHAQQLQRLTELASEPGDS
jgi:hypothetical protein